MENPETEPTQCPMQAVVKAPARPEPATYQSDHAAVDVAWGFERQSLRETAEPRWASRDDRDDRAPECGWCAAGVAQQHSSADPNPVPFWTTSRRYSAASGCVGMRPGFAPREGELSP